MIQMVCFSYKRPLQLHAFLTSLFRHWNDANDDLLVRVLLRSEQPYGDAYEMVMHEFPQVVWCPESDFAPDLSALVDPDPEYTMFGCDDVVYVQPLSESQVADAFDFSDQPLIGLSLRLGANVTRGMFGNPMPHPGFRQTDQFLYWTVSDQRCGVDWAYPWDLDGTVYETSFVRTMLDALEFGNPNELEERGSHVWQQHTERRYMAAFLTARLVVPTVNVVQTTFPGNGVVGEMLSPEYLLHCWDDGVRLDVDALAAAASYESWRIGAFPLHRPVAA